MVSSPHSRHVDRLGQHLIDVGERALDCFAIDVDRFQRHLSRPCGASRESQGEQKWSFFGVVCGRRRIRSRVQSGDVPHATDELKRVVIIA